MTHDYKRNGTTILFAAPDVLKGKVIGDCNERHRYQEFLKFLRRIERWFAVLTNKRIRRDSVFSVADFSAAIEDFWAA